MSSVVEKAIDDLVQVLWDSNIDMGQRPVWTEERWKKWCSVTNQEQRSEDVN